MKKKKIILTLKEVPIGDSYKWSIDLETTNMNDPQTIEVIQGALQQIEKSKKHTTEQL